MQAMLNQAGSEITELKEQVKAKKEKRETDDKLSSDFQESLLTCTNTLEKTKTTFAEERATILKCAEDPESKLDPDTQDLNALKGQISRLCIVVFGKFNHAIKLAICCL